MPLKIKLDLDALAVESFATSDGESGAGTVHAQGVSDTSCQQRLCDCGETGAFNCTQQLSCNGTCVSCNGTCYEATCDTCYDTCGDFCTSAQHVLCSCSPTPQPSMLITECC